MLNLLNTTLFMCHHRHFLILIFLDPAKETDAQPTQLQDTKLR